MATSAVHNFLPSLGGIGSSMLDAVTHPGDTLNALGQVGAGVASQAGLGSQDPAAKAKAEALAVALENHYRTAYGSVAGLKKAIATDPASVMLDASTFLGGAGAGADALGLAKTAGVLAKTASSIDPVANAIRVASLPVKALVTNPITRLTQSALAGVPASALKIAAQAGAETDPALRATFFRHFNGQAPATDYLQAAQQALGQVKQDASDTYVAGKAGLLNQPVPMAKTYAALDKADSELGMGAAAGWPEAKAAIAQARGLVDQFAAKADPTEQNIVNADALKQQIYNLHDSFGNAKAGQYLDQVYHGVKGDITSVDPDYAALMEQYQNGRNNINDISKTLGIGGKNPAAGAALAKSLRAMKTPGGQDLLGQLATKDPSLPYMMAGSALHPWAATGLRGVLESPVAMGLAVAHAPGLIPLQIAGQSPRVAGLLNYGAGAMGRAGASAAMSPAFKGAYYASRAAGEAQPTTTATPPAANGLPPGPGKPPIQATPQDADAATRMVLTEAGGEPDVGKAAALYAFINRAAASGKSLTDEINKPFASESTTAGKGADIDPTSAAYKYVHDNIVVPALNGQIGDPTGGMTHFLNKALQTSEGRAIPQWAQGDGEAIGRHTFYQSFGGRVPRASGGKVEDRHEELVGRLMSAAKQAKKAANKATEPLLNVPDNTVAKALEVAQRAI